MPLLRRECRCLGCHGCRHGSNLVQQLRRLRDEEELLADNADADPGDEGLLHIEVRVSPVAIQVLVGATGSLLRDAPKQPHVLQLPLETKILLELHLVLRRVLNPVPRLWCICWQWRRSNCGAYTISWPSRIRWHSGASSEDRRPPVHEPGGEVVVAVLCPIGIVHRRRCRCRGGGHGLTSSAAATAASTGRSCVGNCRQLYVDVVAVARWGRRGRIDDLHIIASGLGPAVPGVSPLVMPPVRRPAMAVAVARATQPSPALPGSRQRTPAASDSAPWRLRLRPRLRGRRRGTGGGSRPPRAACLEAPQLSPLQTLRLQLHRGAAVGLVYAAH